MKISDFDFSLPDSLIANNPANPRDYCNLMVLNRKSKSISNDVFFHIGNYLKKGDVIVLNDSKVIPARIEFKMEDKNAEIFLLRELEINKWEVIGKPGKKLKEGVCFKINNNVSFKVTEAFDDGRRIVQFDCSNQDVKNFLDDIGATPLPPYIKNSTSSSDDYQTIFAKNPGSVAAPTAGLHFTNRLIDELKSKGIGFEYATLHVGLGTFLPVKTDTVEDHVMHKEYFELKYDVAKRLNEAKKVGNRIIAVGTTAVRILETSYDVEKGFISGKYATSIYIYPGYKWKCVDAMITNFHLPKSSLILLVSSLAGTDLIKTAYQKAIEQHYRFYSFGDAMLIL